MSNLVNTSNHLKEYTEYLNYEKNFSKYTVKNYNIDINKFLNYLKTKEITINTSKKVNEKDKNQIEQSNSKLITSLVKKISEQNWFLKRSEIDKIILKIEKRYD